MKGSFCRLFLICFFIVTGMSVAEAQTDVTVKGVVYDTDSINPIAFVYALNRNTYVGTMTDAAGSFELSAKLSDTLIFNYLGYEVRRLLVGTFKDSVKNNLLKLKVVLVKKPYNLQQVIIMSTEFSKEEKQYYSDKVSEYERFKSQGISSPITGLYMAFSHEGKSMKKLTEMYDQLLYDELLEKRLSDAKLRQVTGDENLDCKAFRNYCRLSENFLRLASEYDLFVAVAKLYPDFKSGKKPYRRAK
jgi:hypothetical protein